MPRIKIPKKDITEYFNSLEQKVFMKKNIDEILFRKRSSWNLPKTMNVNKFISELNKMHLTEIKLKALNYDSTYSRFIWGHDDLVYQLCLSLKPRSYFSHQTAMYFHGLTDKNPKTIYANSEQSLKSYRDNSLEQGRIDAAFKRKPRTSKYIFSYKDWKICCLNGINTKNLGVTEIDVLKEGELPVTNMERTLIDIAVRPVYSGGCKEVLEAYRRAKGKISVDTLITMLGKINYIYPYHQAIGVYMQTAGFDESDFNKLKKLGLRYDFYLDYDMKKTEYSKEWRIYYPKNL